MRRYDGLKAVAPKVGDALVVTNLANTATEWRTLRPHDGNLYFVGMGMVTPYALGLALALPHRRVLAFDGDGGILFEMSVLGTLAQSAPRNLCVVVLDNEGYVSTGKWRSVASLSAGPVDIAGVARASGLANVFEVRTVEAFEAEIAAGLEREDGPTVIVAKTSAEQAFVGTSPGDGKENKYGFVRHIEALEGKAIDPKSNRVFSHVRERGAEHVELSQWSSEARLQGASGLLVECHRVPGLRYSARREYTPGKKSESATRSCTRFDRLGPLQRGNSGLSGGRGHSRQAERLTEVRGRVHLVRFSWERPLHRQGKEFQS